MVASRHPGVFGTRHWMSPIDKGTLNRSRSPAPGVPLGRQAEHQDADPLRTDSLLIGIRRSNGAVTASCSLRIQVPVLRVGTHGANVGKLQQLLNLRLVPSPQLAVDQTFGALTLAALQAFQRAAGLSVDGVAGKDTWRLLGSGRLFHISAPPPEAQGGPQQAGTAALSLPKPAAPASVSDVLSWSTDKKFLEVTTRAINKLPGEMRAELLSMISPFAIAVTLAFWAASHFVGAGEAIDLALLAAGVFMLGSAIVGVMAELGDCLVTTYGAGSEQELDAAAAMLAHVIAVIGVATLVALLAKIRANRGSAMASESAAVEAEQAASAARKAKSRSASPTEPARPHVEDAVAPAKTTNKPASCAGGNCTQAGEPVSMVTGEEMLELEDFTWDGPLALRWRRFYRSGSCALGRVLGYGWLSPLDEYLEIDSDVVYVNADDQRITLPLPSLNSYSVNLPEKLRLYRDADGFRVVGEDGLEHLFTGGKGRARLRGWRNRAGQSIEVMRNGTGEATGLVADWGRSLRLDYAQGRIVAISPARLHDGALDVTGAPFVRYEYSDAGDLVAVRDRLDHGERYRYDDHLLVQRSLASGFNFYFEWDTSGLSARCVHSWGDGGNYDFRFEWLPGGVSRATDSRGGVVEYEHNTAAQLLSARSPEGHVTRYSYNAQNLLRSVIDPSGNITRYEYDYHGRVLAVTDALGNETRLRYDVDGNPVALTDATREVWARRYDAPGRLIEERDPAGATTRFDYNRQGLLAQVTDAVGRRRHLLWDEQMRLVGESGFDGVRRRYQYDDEDRIVAVVVHNRVTVRYEYDARGQVIAVHAPDGGTTRLRYNAAGAVTHFTDAADHTTEYRYEDGLSQVTSRVDPLGRVMRYEYDLERNLTALINPKGEVYRLGYDLDERLTDEVGFDGRTQRYAYDASGWLRSHLEAQHSTEAGKAWRETHFARDRCGRLLEKRGAAGAVVRFGYDPNGRLLTANTADSTIEISRDAVGSVWRDSQNGAVITYEYDALGRRTGLTTPDGLRIAYRYDGQGRLSAVELDGKPLTGHRYDELGREVGRTQGALDSEFEYDLMGRLVRHQAAHKGAEAILGRRYDYDPVGRLSAVEDFRAGSTRYVYDPADRLLEVQGLQAERFVHDPAGNLLGASAEGGLVKGDRLLMMGDRHFSYDIAGNLIEERRGTGGALVTRYAYDDDNRMVEAVTPRENVQFRYDALGRRIAKRSRDGETRFLYSGVNLLTEVRNDWRRTYLFEPDSFRPLAVIEANGNNLAQQIYHYHLDHLGTPREMTDTLGRVVWAARYRAYGALALAEVDEVDNPLRFQGQYYDRETGLHYNFNRYFDPESGRFVHQDPIGLAGGDNVYLYAPNPVNWVDPLGLMCAETAKVVAINAQKQAGHLPGTPQNINRIKQGKPTSSFHGEHSGEMATRIAHERGTPVPGRPNVKEYDFGVGVGTGPNGGTQTRVRVHESPKTGEIHGHPSGPEKF